jgi:hypothetical protein
MSKSNKDKKRYNTKQNDEWEGSRRPKKIKKAKRSRSYYDNDDDLTYDRE